MNNICMCDIVNNYVIISDMKYVKCGFYIRMIFFGNSNVLVFFIMGFNILIDIKDLRYYFI